MSSFAFLEEVVLVLVVLVLIYKEMQGLILYFQVAILPMLPQQEEVLELQ